MLHITHTSFRIPLVSLNQRCPVIMQRERPESHICNLKVPSSHISKNDNDQVELILIRLFTWLIKKIISTLTNVKIMKEIVYSFYRMKSLKSSVYLALTAYLQVKGSGNIRDWWLLHWTVRLEL